MNTMTVSDINTIYTKKGNRYIPVGQQWAGFPSSGVWIVMDARSNSKLKIKEIKEVQSPNRINYNSEDLIQHWKDSIEKNNNTYSQRDLINWGLNFIANNISNEQTTFPKIKNILITGEDYFVKVGNRYTKLNRYDFCGWPTDGVWIVNEGCQTCVIDFKDDNSVSIEAVSILALTIEVEEHVRYQLEGMSFSNGKDMLNCYCAAFNLFFSPVSLESEEV